MGYYTPDGIRRYMAELPNIEYFEIRSEVGEFICSIPASTFGQDINQYEHDIDLGKLRSFIEAIEENSVPDAFSEPALTFRRPVST